MNAAFEPSGRPNDWTDEPEPQVTDPETRERIREKIEADALDESGGPWPEPEAEPVPAAARSPGEDPRSSEPVE
ncbi:MAG: hypothetical protein GX547_12845 [Phycisphaerae bacterium]|nr:hypothetical protein [Phycisphaerae bacterium]